MRQKAAESQYSSYRAHAQTNSLIVSLELGQQLERCLGHMGKNELSGFRAKSGRADFSQIDMLAEAIVPLLSPPPTQHM